MPNSACSHLQGSQSSRRNSVQHRTSRRKSKLGLKRASPVTSLLSSQRKTSLSAIQLFRIASPERRGTQHSPLKLKRSNFTRISREKRKTCLRSHLLNISRNTCEFQEEVHYTSKDIGTLAEVSSVYQLNSVKNCFKRP